jgi:hypothetical protein
MSVVVMVLCPSRTGNGRARRQAERVPGRRIARRTPFLHCKDTSKFHAATGVAQRRVMHESEHDAAPPLHDTCAKVSSEPRRLAEPAMETCLAAHVSIRVFAGSRKIIRRDLMVIQINKHVHFSFGRPNGNHHEYSAPISMVWTY